MILTLQLIPCQLLILVPVVSHPIYNFIDKNIHRNVKMPYIKHSAYIFSSYDIVRQNCLQAAVDFLLE